MRTFKTKNCLSCGALYTPTGGCSKFCPDCSDVGKQKICLFCGKIFTGSKIVSKFCSVSCSAKARETSEYSEDRLKKSCSKCKEMKDLDCFRAEKNGKLRSVYKACDYIANYEYYQTEEGKQYRQSWQRQERLDRLEVCLVREARKRAKEKNIPFNITPEDIFIPEFCPALGIKLKRGLGPTEDSSPSLDRFIPSLGYAKGNVTVISHKANTIKNNASVEEVEKVANWMKLSLGGK